ncbi:MAG: hypothetical protein ACE5IQ_11950 [Candidatus Methylomirabilales bacterium]
MATRPYKRRRILIDRFQYRLLVINLLYSLTIVLIFAATLFLPLILQLESGTLSIMEQGEVATQFLSLHARVWPALFVIFALLALHSIVVSHRIAGPLYRFRNIFRAVGEGDLSVRANLRKRDYLGKESDSLNAMITRLRTKIQHIEEPYEDLCAVVHAFESAIERGSIEDMSRHLENLRLHMERFKASLAQFRIDTDATGGQDEVTRHSGPSAASRGPAPPPRSSQI